VRCTESIRLIPVVQLIADRGSVFPAEEPAAGFGPLVIDGALSRNQKFAAVLDDQAVAAREGEVETTGAEALEPFVFGPGEIHARECPAAGPVAFPAAAVIVDRAVHEHAVLFNFRTDQERHLHAPWQPADGEGLFRAGCGLPGNATVPRFLPIKC